LLNKIAPPWLETLLRYLLALGIWAIAVYARFLLLPFAEGYPHLTIYPVTIFAFLAFGFGPGLMVTLLSCLLTFFFFTPPFFEFQFDHEIMVILLIYISSSLMIGAIISKKQALAARLQAEINERKLMDAHNSLLLAALEAAANGIVITDKDEVIIWVNPAYSRITGYSLEEVVGYKPGDLDTTGLHDQTYYKNMWQAVLEGRAWCSEVVNMHKNGSLYHEKLSIAPIKNSAGDITHFIGIKEDITARKEMEAQLQKLAHTDPLTGLNNRRIFFEQLEIERAKISRLPQYSVVMLMLDLDFFKQVNDKFGHATGDAVLKAVAEIMRKNSRIIDVPARLGGEEFAVLLTGANKLEGLTIAERLRQQIESLVIAHELGEVKITASIGAAYVLPDDDNAEAVLHRADAALYLAKSRGRNRTCWCFTKRKG
jgi:diguanylate cyclase (GGDEF)-like protein/PAS domain S-box-containing protein